MNYLSKVQYLAIAQAEQTSINETHEDLKKDSIKVKALIEKIKKLIKLL